MGSLCVKQEEVEKKTRLRVVERKDFKKIGVPFDTVHSVQEIGRGAFSTVYLVIHEKTNAKYAMKVITKKHLKDQGLHEIVMSI